MSKVFYSKDHEWVVLEADGLATIGVTDHAQSALGDIVFVELPELGRNVAKNEACAVVESVKAASDVYAPLSGMVAEVNQSIVDEPAKVNEAPEGEGWFFKLRLDDPASLKDLLDRAAYDEYLRGLA